MTVTSASWLGKENISELYNQLFTPLFLSLTLSLSLSATQMNTRAHETLSKVQEWMFSSVIQYS